MAKQTPLERMNDEISTMRQKINSKEYRKVAIDFGVFKAEIKAEVAVQTADVKAKAAIKGRMALAKAMLGLSEADLATLRKAADLTKADKADKAAAAAAAAAAGK